VNYTLRHEQRRTASGSAVASNFVTCSLANRHQYLPPSVRNGSLTRHNSCVPRRVCILTALPPPMKVVRILYRLLIFGYPLFLPLQQVGSILLPCSVRFRGLQEFKFQLFLFCTVWGWSCFLTGPINLLTCAQHFHGSELDLTTVDRLPSSNTCVSRVLETINDPFK
jgi:hypothetical protein